MEKLFSFNKLFFLFCIVFILEWLALQVVSYMRLTGMAKLDGERILGWCWPDKNIRSVIQVYDTKILRRETADAIVKVLAKQAIEPISPLSATTATATTMVPTKTTTTISATTGQPLDSASQCAVTLTYYRTNYQWYLGKVDWQ